MAFSLLGCHTQRPQFSEERATWLLVYSTVTRDQGSKEWQRGIEALRKQGERKVWGAGECTLLGPAHTRLLAAWQLWTLQWIRSRMKEYSIPGPLSPSNLWMDETSGPTGGQTRAPGSREWLAKSYGAASAAILEKLTQKLNKHLHKSHATFCETTFNW